MGFYLMLIVKKIEWVIYNYNICHLLGSFLGTYKEHGGLALVCSLFMVLLVDFGDDVETAVEEPVKRANIARCSSCAICACEAVGGTAIPAIVEFAVGAEDIEPGLNVYLDAEVFMVRASRVVLIRFNDEVLFTLDPTLLLSTLVVPSATFSALHAGIGDIATLLIDRSIALLDCSTTLSLFLRLFALFMS